LTAVGVFEVLALGGELALIRGYVNVGAAVANEFTDCCPDRPERGNK